MFQQIVAYAEAKRLESYEFGATGLICEADAFVLGYSRKGGAGKLSVNKCYVQFLGERKGEILLEVFPQPRGGSERLSNIRHILDRISDNAELATDKARTLIFQIFST
jgi:hypothetical protein